MEGESTRPKWNCRQDQPDQQGIEEFTATRQAEGRQRIENADEEISAIICKKQ